MPIRYKKKLAKDAGFAIMIWQGQAMVPTRQKGIFS
jgi:hypothetical protein